MAERFLSMNIEDYDKPLLTMDHSKVLGESTPIPSNQQTVAERYLSVNIEDYDKPLPTMDHPTVLGEFTEDTDGNITLGRENAPYLNMKHLNSSRLWLNLNEGFNEEAFRKLTDKLRTKDSNTFLEWLRTYSEGDTVKEKCHGADVVTYCGMLSRMATTPYIRSDKYAWKCVAKRDRQNDVTFIGYKEAESVAQRYNHETYIAESLEKSYAGMRFEQYATSKHNQEPNTNADVGVRDKFHAVLKMDIGRDARNFGLLYMAEVDCIEPNDDKYVELKVHPVSDQLCFWNVTLRWWTKAFLSTTPEFLIGFRGFANTTIKYCDKKKLHQLEEDQLKFYQKAIPWKRAVCFNFLASVLETLDDFLSEPGVDSCVVEFEFGEKRVVFRTCEENETLSLTGPLKEYLGVE